MKAHRTALTWFRHHLPRQIVAALRQHTGATASARGADAYLRQVRGREFAHHLLYRFPATADHPLDAGVRLGHPQPRPLVDLGNSRKRALQVYSWPKRD